MKKIVCLRMILVVLLLSFNIGAFANDDEPVINNDPYETFNRPMFIFNEWLDKLVLKPTAILYTKIVPRPLAKGISNAYNNINTVPTIANDLLQFNFYQAINDTWRLGINTTLGIGGLFDVASWIGLEPNNTQDFGLTLARWGWESSNYLVLPLFGPGTLRDQLAIWPNYYLTIYPLLKHDDALYYPIFFGSLVVMRADVLRYESMLQQAAFDKYTFVKNAYMQRRSYLINRNKQLGNPYMDKNSILNLQQEI